MICNFSQINKLSEQLSYKWFHHPIKIDPSSYSPPYSTRPNTSRQWSPRLRFHTPTLSCYRWAPSHTAVFSSLPATTPSFDVFIRPVGVTIIRVFVVFIILFISSRSAFIAGSFISVASRFNAVFMLGAWCLRWSVLSCFWGSGPGRRIYPGFRL